MVLYNLFIYRYTVYININSFLYLCNGIVYTIIYEYIIILLNILCKSIVFYIHIMLLFFNFININEYTILYYINIFTLFYITSPAYCSQIIILESKKIRRCNTLMLNYTFFTIRLLITIYIYIPTYTFFCKLYWGWTLLNNIKKTSCST